MENYYRIKIGGFYFSEILPSKESVSERNERSTYYTPTRDERQRLGFKYDLWFSLILFLDQASKFKSLMIIWMYNQVHRSGNLWDDIFKRTPPVVRKSRKRTKLEQLVANFPNSIVQSLQDVIKVSNLEILFIFC